MHVTLSSTLSRKRAREQTNRCASFKLTKVTEFFRAKEVYGVGFVEIVIWNVPEPVPPSEHPYKYRLVYIVEGKRIVGYDNERGKGDHKHLGDMEQNYCFVNPRQLMADFMADVKGVLK